MVLCGRERYSESWKRLHNNDSYTLVRVREAVMDKLVNAEMF